MFDPGWRTAGPVRRVEAFPNDTFDVVGPDQLEQGVRVDVDRPVSAISSVRLVGTDLRAYDAAGAARCVEPGCPIDCVGVAAVAGHEQYQQPASL